jgi:putative FMN-dependent luciferase-like monooxygenase
MTAPNASNHTGITRPDVPFRLGVFTRLVDEVAPAEVYARALRLFETAEELGFDTGWVAQHHAHNQGGMPSPLVFLTAAAARTAHLRLATGIITLPLEDPVRVAEDAAVLDILCGGRLELGFGTGGSPEVFSIFGRELDQRQADYDRAFAIVRDALLGKPLTPDGPAMFPPAGDLMSRTWEATFGVDGAIRAARHGSGLLLSRTQPRPPAPNGAPASFMPLDEVQTPIVDGYLAHWSGGEGMTPRIGLSRSIYVAPTRAEALADAETGMRRQARQLATRGDPRGSLPYDQYLAQSDVHLGNPEDVIASLQADRLLASATDLILQVHPIDPSPEKTLRSLRLIAAEVAPALGWRPAHHERAQELVPNTER